jgi:hypothetical protein
MEPVEKCHSEALAEESQICNILSLLDSSPAKGGVRMTEGTFHGFSTDSMDSEGYGTRCPIPTRGLSIFRFWKTKAFESFLR